MNNKIKKLLLLPVVLLAVNQKAIGSDESTSDQSIKENIGITNSEAANQGTIKTGDIEENDQEQENDEQKMRDEFRQNIQDLLVRQQIQDQLTQEILGRNAEKTDDAKENVQEQENDEQKMRDELQNFEDQYAQFRSEQQERLMLRLMQEILGRSTQQQRAQPELQQLLMSLGNTLDIPPELQLGVFLGQLKQGRAPANNFEMNFIQQKISITLPPITETPPTEQWFREVESLLDAKGLMQSNKEIVMKTIRQYTTEEGKIIKILLPPSMFKNNMQQQKPEKLEQVDAREEQEEKEEQE